MWGGWPDGRGFCQTNVSSKHISSCNTLIALRSLDRAMIQILQVRSSTSHYSSLYIRCFVESMVSQMYTRQMRQISFVLESEETLFPATLISEVLTMKYIASSSSRFY